ncbi:multiple PDZ domain protein-like isoform X1 [Euwallacea similis]|uniref:multiple PDZ domain protein-like isoform X1 n=1 Tax=Euwallacea similis TaxID=1736056 RepID=UPI00344F1E70
MVLNTEWAQVEVIDLINDGSGLAFGIIGGRSTGVVVKTILPGGVADRDGRLQSGDHILQIGEVNLRGLGSEQVASVLRQCGVHVRMVVARPVDSTTADIQALGSHAPIVPTKILGDPIELEKHLLDNGFPGTCASMPPMPYMPLIFGSPNPISDIVDVVRNPLPIGKIPIPKICPPPPPLTPPTPENDQSLPETETFSIELKKDDLGLGITVAGYVCEKEEISGIFVKSISKGSAADSSRIIKVNDRIIEVNGTSVIGYTNHQAVEFLKNAGPSVRIKFERYLRGPKYEQLQQAIKANELRPPSPPSPTVSSLPKIPFSLVHMAIEPEGESRTSVDFDSTILFDSGSPADEEKEIVIDGGKSVHFSQSSRESIRDKWADKVDKEAQILIAQMSKTENKGLGISLEGTVDVENGVELRPHHYIRNVLPDGPVGLNGLLQPGDELLEANGLQLLGLNHLEVVSILKQLPMNVCLVCARYPVPIRIIDTSQCPDAFQARKILAGSFQTLIPAEQSNLVKAKSETSIASSVGSEGLSAGKSRSLELIAGLPMWCEEPTVVELHKGDHGLGFSILDYQDPLNPQETVIVIRSLVPGGVAQADGKLKPGDRLLAVNDVDVARAYLDVAVQVLKGAPKGVVRISVAKPLNGGDAVSYASQFLRKILHRWSDEIGYLILETEDDHTCLEDFQECIEEFQEDLVSGPIYCDDDRPFNHSPPTSQVEDFGQKNRPNHIINHLDVNRDSIGDSDVDISFKSTNENCLDPGARNNVRGVVKDLSFTQTLHNTLSSERDDYDTCIEGSLSDETTKIERVVVSEALDDITPTNSKVDLSVTFPKPSAKNQCSSEPCLATESFPDSKHICLESKLDPDYCEGDEFFLVQYPSTPTRETVCKSMSEPNVLESPDTPVARKLTYKLREYYNDYENCLDAYKNVAVYEKIDSEMSDSQIFNEILLPFKSRSAPDVMNRSFVTLTYDPGPEGGRRKSAFVTGYTNIEGEMTVIRHVEPNHGIMKDSQGNVLHKHWGSPRVVKVYREPEKSLGISIVGGKVDVQPSENQPKALLGIFVKNVTPGTAADKIGQFKTGDRILEVSGIDLREATHEKAVEAIRGAPNPVVFLVQSLIPWTNADDQNNIPNEESFTHLSSPASHSSLTDEKPLAINHDVNDNVPPPSKEEVVKTENNREEKKEKNGVETEREGALISDDESAESEEDEVDTIQLEGRTVSLAGQQIDRASAANVRRNKEEIAADNEKEDEFGYTNNKVKKKYGNLGHGIHMVQLERGAAGLGLSLAGHRDRSCMAVFVCGLNPNGAACKTGLIQIGDEILEVNGVVLHGRCHLNASAIIKGLTGPVFKVILLRRKAAINDIAVKPITQFPVSLAEETSVEHFSSNYPNVRSVSIKKQTGQSLGIMIIEGKHAEVGQGIFISDIQEGSAAEKAGLEIGEMILAVNKDSLVGSNYDTAANLLKRTEGLVNLVVSKPGKKDQSRSLTPTPLTQTNSVADGKAGLKTPTTPSRPTTPVPEPPADPQTCSILPGKETVIEVNTNNESLGVAFVGGKDTIVGGAIILTEIYSNGSADRDGRLQAGDQIGEVNGASLKDSTNTTASQALRQTLPKMKITVFRPSNLEYTSIEVDLIKKPGKGLGLSLIGRKCGKGVYVADVIPGTSAELDGRITKGDVLVAVNGVNVENATGDETGAILKTATGRVSLKLHRFKPSSSNQ